MPIPFEAGKNAKELGIDTSRTFVVLNENGSPFEFGEIVAIAIDDDTEIPRFESTKTGAKGDCFWSRLAYADETEPYQPRIGDRVSLEGEVMEVEEGGRLTVHLLPSAGELYVYPIDVANGVLKLLSRKTRRLTKEEAERLLCEKLNEQITIE